MSDYSVSIPEDVYERARQIAAETAQPIEQVIVEHLRSLSAPVPQLPPDEEAELEALKHLSDDALWTIAAEQMPHPLQERLQVLMPKNSLGSIAADEYAELEGLVERGQRLMVRKSEAAALLTQRGYQVTPQDMAGRE